MGMQLALAALAIVHGAVSDSAIEIRISIAERRLALVAGGETVRTAVVAVASGDALRYGGRTWSFRTPRGRFVVRAKRSDPVWTPPDWHYAEAARAHNLRLAPLPARGLTLPDGRRLVVRSSTVGLTTPDGGFAPLPADEHIVFGETLFIPPIGTANRRVFEALGDYALDLGAGYMLHGTRDAESLGRAVTHGCIRLSDTDLEWLYQHVPVGTVVDIR